MNLDFFWQPSKGNIILCIMYIQMYMYIMFIHTGIHVLYTCTPVPLIIIVLCVGRELKTDILLH